MKKISVLFLIFVTVLAFSQNPTDSLLNILESVKDTSRVRVLKELCWTTRYSNPPEALKYGHEALSLLKQIHMYQEETELNNFVGIIQRNIGDNATALEHFFSAQRLAERHGFDREFRTSGTRQNQYMVR
ncbi:hypothetical protein ACFLTA_05150 [Bacteroidota bacterium]